MDQAAVLHSHAIGNRCEGVAPFANSDVVVVVRRAAGLLLHEDATAIGLIIIEPAFVDAVEEFFASVPIRRLSATVRWVEPDEARRHPHWLSKCPVLDLESRGLLDEAVVIALHDHGGVRGDTEDHGPRKPLPRMGEKLCMDVRFLRILKFGSVYIP